VNPPAAAAAGGAGKGEPGKQRGGKQKAEELPYVSILNRLLPLDIRVLAACEVAPTFNARFDCLYREYRYFFMKRDLDIERMREAAGYLVGTHNFKNFCKIDRAKAVTNYVREIMQFEVSEAGAVTDASDPSLQMYEFSLRGTAFLWHQVRYMVSVLFLVGQRLEEPTVRHLLCLFCFVLFYLSHAHLSVFQIVKDLLDPAIYPKRPAYGMASEIPLVLNDCAFEDLPYDFNLDVHERNISQFLEALQEEAIKVSSILTVIGQLRDMTVPRPAGLPKVAFDGDEFVAYRLLHPVTPSRTTVPKKYIKIANLPVVGNSGTLAKAGDMDYADEGVDEGSDNDNANE